MDIIIIFFSIFIILLAFGILRNWREKYPKINNYSIIIVCRNEEQNLPALFSSLEKIYYNKKKYEIILVDDASNDNTFGMMIDFCKKNINSKCYHIRNKNSSYKGKKAALKKGIDNAKFRYFLFTDADCLVPPNWLNSYNNYISKNIGMVVGYSPELGVSRFRKFTQLTSAAIYAATIGLGIPFSSHGRNILVSKKAYKKVKGFDNYKDYPCGEDKLLLQQINKENFKILYNSEVKVFTKPNIDEFYDQQKRRYGQFNISSVTYKIISIFVFLFYLYFPAKILFYQDWKSLILYLIAANFFWISTLIKHNEKFHIIDIFYILIYPYYLIFFSIWGMFGKWEWK